MKWSLACLPALESNVVEITTFDRPRLASFCFLAKKKKKKKAENQILNDNKYLFFSTILLRKIRASNPVILKVLRVMGKWSFPGEADPAQGGLVLC